ncbi:cell division protein FtsQ/DivIB [Rarobacter faecitabidus]|uniref:Cell division protein FtsQ n=1 Tax=Rarobacter faecitabidus TaxID=13243 RepID=A0A542ZW83_RARFA|nr:FtsQ-type POTRA domain-containing protein [Rarobacter faecitabidus]TQL64615.1 cell division protein FtsQ [Rarobacter faecitabidus]
MSDGGSSSTAGATAAQGDAARKPTSRDDAARATRARAGTEPRTESSTATSHPGTSQRHLPAVPPPPESSDGAMEQKSGVLGPLTGAQARAKSRSVVSTGLQARLAEKRSIERARRMRRWSWIGGSVALFAVVMWVIFFSPLLALDANRVTIEGASQTVDESAVAELVDSQIGTPLPRLNTTALRNEIKNVRGVRDVTLRRQWPSGLAVIIDARQPVAAVADGSASGSYVLLDSEAVQVGRAKKVPKDLPVIDIPLGQDNSDVLESVLVVLEAIPEDLSTQLKSVSASTKDDILLTLKGDTEVNWGDSSNNKLKAAVLEVLLADEANAQVKKFDVSAPTAPITS